MEMEYQKGVQSFAAIMFGTPFSMGMENQNSEMGSIFRGHNILNPCSIFYRGFNISQQNSDPGFRISHNILNPSSIFQYQNII